MREAYSEQLSHLSDDLAEMCDAVAEAMRRATTALLTADLALAEQVISEDVHVDRMRDAVEENSFALLALQAPVAGDLRTVVSAIQACSDIERMGGLALHVAQAARRRHPQHVLPEQVEPYFAEMGKVAVQLAGDASRVIRTRDVELAVRLDSDDDAMDSLHRHLFTVMMARDWPHGAATAVDVALLGRFYERFADHAVALARQVVFVVTGHQPADASA